MKRHVLTALVAAVAPATAAAHKHRAHVPGCASRSCDDRIGDAWSKRHPRARKTSVSMRAFVQPYLGFLAKLRACEVRGQPHPYQTNTGNGFYGAYQFTVSSWAAVGGSGLPSNAPPLEQDYRAVRLLKAQGPGAWPVCSQ